MIAIETAHLFDMKIEVPVEQSQEIGNTPVGHRRIVKVTGGVFEGPKLKGTVVEGDDWLLLHADGVMQLDCRMTLRTDDGHAICMTYQGRRHGPAEVMERMSRGEEVAVDDYYHRVTPYFETASDKYSWLNGIVSVAVGHKRPWGGVYSVHQIT